LTQIKSFETKSGIFVGQIIIFQSYWEHYNIGVLKNVDFDFPVNISCVTGVNS